MPEKHVPHHEDQRQCQLNLQLVDAGNVPETEVLDLEAEMDTKDEYSVDEESVRPEVDVLELWVVQLVD